MSAFTDFVLSLGPLCWYRLHETSGNPLDSSGYGRDMAVNSGLTYSQAGALASSESNNAITNGATGYCHRNYDDPGMDFTYDANFTIVFWAKWSVATDNMRAIDKSSASSYPFQIRANGSTGKMAFIRWDGTNNPAVWCDDDMNDGAWHFYAARKSGGAGGTLQWFTDGCVNAGSATDTTTGTTGSTGYVNLFKISTSSASYFVGGLDEVMIFGSALGWNDVALIEVLGRVGGYPQPTRPVHISRNPGTLWLPRRYN